MAEANRTNVPAHLQDKTFGKDSYTVQEIISGRRKGKFYSFHPTAIERDQIYTFCHKHNFHARSLPTPSHLFELLHTIGYFNDWQTLNAHLAHRLLDYICHAATQHALTPQGNTFVAPDAWQSTKADLKEALLKFSEDGGHPRRPSLAGSKAAGLPDSAGQAVVVNSQNQRPTSTPSSTTIKPVALPSPITVSTAAPPPTPDQKALLTTLRLKLPVDVSSADLYAELCRAAQHIRQTIAARDVEVETLRQQYINAKKMQREAR